MRTPEEIKKGLEHCKPIWKGDHWKNCDEKCPYSAEMSFCKTMLNQDALAYIQQLEAREWDLLDLLSSAWLDKRCYFQQDNRTVYSRVSGEYMSFDQAIDEFAHNLTDERKNEPWRGKNTNTLCWISVEERLPEVSDVVLVVANGKPLENITLDNALLIASFWGEEGWIADGFEGWDALKVTHWMPLPESPKEG